MRFGKLCLVVVAMLLAVQLATATAIDPINDRPVVVGSPASGEVALQTLLNTIYGCNTCVNANTDQQSAGMWGLPGRSSMSPQLQFEYAGNASANVFGLWYTPDTTIAPTMVPIFFGPAVPGQLSVATVVWTDANTLVIGNPFGIAGINTGTFTGIPQGAFGFYLQGPGGTFFTVDQLNANGSPQSVAYNYGPLDRWTIGFEDQPYASTDKDYNDLVVSVESIHPVPEPASLLLLGTGLFGLGGFIRRKLH